MDANEQQAPRGPAPDDPGPEAFDDETQTGGGEAPSALADLQAAMAFLTRLPPQWTGHDPASRPDFSRIAQMFPVVGALVGAAGGLILLITSALGMPIWLACTLAVLTTVLITGALHEDGLADTTDALGANSTDKRFAILDDSRVGTFGALALGFSLLIRISALAAIGAGGPIRAVLILIAAEAISRAAMVRMWHDLPAARAGGLSTSAGGPDARAAMVALAAGAVIALLGALASVGISGTLVAAVLTIAATYGMLQLALARFGGHTGDILGASQQVAMLAFLAGATAGW